MADRTRVVVASLGDGRWAAHKVNANGTLRAPRKEQVGEKYAVIDAVFAEIPDAAVEIYRELPELSTEAEDELIRRLEEDLARARRGRDDKLKQRELLNKIKAVRVDD